MPKTPDTTKSGVLGKYLTTDIVPETAPNLQVFLPTLNCPACGCDRLNFIRSQPPITHFGSYRCSGCDCFRGWAQNPANREKREQLQQLIASLLESPTLTNWERSFLESIRNQRKLSPKQQEKLNVIATKGER